jgi:hypothetical protein
VYPQKHQTAVAGVDQRVNALRNHGGAAGKDGGREFRSCNRQIRSDGGIDDFSRFTSHEFRVNRERTALSEGKL